MFSFSLKLLVSNWTKALKFFLYYLVIWGICFAMLLPTFFAFKGLFQTNFQNQAMLNSLSGVFKGSVGDGLHNFFTVCYTTFLDACNSNLGLVIYGLIVMFIVLPFLINIGKATYSSMLYSYMTSKTKVGFFSALVKSLSYSALFSLVKTIYNLFIWAIIIVSCFGLGMLENSSFITYVLPIAEILVLTLIFTCSHMLVLGWLSALIVFNCNVFKAFHKGLKAVRRHFWTTFAMTLCLFFWFWLFVLIFGIFSLVILVPILNVVLCTINMVTFFSSQGMRFYYNENNISTPKKLEEVDNINKTAFIL